MGEPLRTPSRYASPQRRRPANRSITEGKADLSSLRRCPAQSPRSGSSWEERPCWNWRTGVGLSRVRIHQEVEVAAFVGLKDMFDVERFVSAMWHGTTGRDLGGATG